MGEKEQQAEEWWTVHCSTPVWVGGSGFGSAKVHCLESVCGPVGDASCCLLNEELADCSSATFPVDQMFSGDLSSFSGE